MGRQQHLKFEEIYRSPNPDNCRFMKYSKWPFSNIARFLSQLWLANLKPNFQFGKWQLPFHCWAPTLLCSRHPSKLLLVQFGYRVSHLEKRSKFGSKGHSIASIYVISVAINGWAIFIIFLRCLFNEIKMNGNQNIFLNYCQQRGALSCLASYTDFFSFLTFLDRDSRWIQKIINVLLHTNIT